jgi:hypothetical protein
MCFKCTPPVLKGSSGSAVKEALLKEFIFVMIALSFSEKFVEQKPFKKVV